MSIFNFGTEWKRFAYLVGFCEIPMESFCQLLLQVYIGHFYYFGVRKTSSIQELSLATSYVFIVYQLTIFLKPGILSKNSHMWLIVQRTLWPVMLNSLIVYNFIAYMNLSSPEVIDFYGRIYNKPVHITYTTSLPILVLYVCSCFQVFIIYKSKSVKHSKIVKFTCVMLTTGMLLFLSFHLYFAYFAYLAVLRTSGSVSLTQKFMLSYLSVLVICDLLVACIFAKATFTISSVSEIWNLDKVFLFNLNRTGNASIVLFLIFTVLHCCVFLRNFP